MGTFWVSYFNTVKTVGAGWSSVKESIKILTYAIFDLRHFYVSQTRWLLLQWNPLNKCMKI